MRQVKRHSGTSTTRFFHQLGSKLIFPGNAWLFPSNVVYLGEKDVEGKTK